MRLEGHDACFFKRLGVERALQQAAAWSGGELATLVRWIDALSGQVLSAHPHLCLDAS